MNDLEHYFLEMRRKIDGPLKPYLSDEDKASFEDALMKAEDWLMDHYEEKKVAYVEKLDELKKMGDPPQWRMTESEAREEWISAVTGTVSNYKAAAQDPGDAYSHIAPEKLALIVKECETTEKWLKDKIAEQ